MRKQFERRTYDLDCGFQLNHTYGYSAENSTAGYLHDVDRFLIYYFIKGSGNIKIEGNRFEINEGDLIILNPAEMFCCSIDKNRYHERLTLHITQGVLKNFPGDCAAVFSPFFSREKKLCSIIKKEDAVLYGLHKSLPEIHELVQSPTPENKLLSICKVIEFFTALDKISSYAAGDHTTTSSNSIVDSVIEYLNQHFSENLNVNAVAKKFSLNSSYLAHLFKEHVGISLWNYVIIKRIHLFNDLISKGGSIEENCYKAGFQNYSNFFRLYKKHMKMTPLEYKQKAKTM